MRRGWVITESFVDGVGRWWWVFHRGPERRVEVYRIKIEFDLAGAQVAG